MAFDKKMPLRYENRVKKESREKVVVWIPHTQKKSNVIYRQWNKKLRKKYKDIKNKTVILQLKKKFKVKKNVLARIIKSYEEKVLQRKWHQITGKLNGKTDAKRVHGSKKNIAVLWGKKSESYEELSRNEQDGVVR